MTNLARCKTDGCEALLDIDVETNATGYCGQHRRERYTDLPPVSTVRHPRRKAVKP